MRILAALLLCLGFFACSNNPTTHKNDYPKHVQLARFQSPDGHISKLSSVAKRIEYIVLETNNDCLIGTTSNIQATSDGVLIGFRNAIYYFGNDGRYRSKIDHVGKGPGEYLRILPHYIHNPIKQEIVIPDGRQSLLVFDYSGKHIKSIECKSQTGMDFSALLPDGNFFLSPFLLYSPMFTTIGKNGDILREFFPGKVEIQRSGDEGGLYFPRLWISNHHEGVLASDSDTTWLVKDAQTAIPFMIIDPFVNKKEDKVYVSPINYLNNNYIGFDGREYGIYSLRDNKYYTVNGKEKRKVDDDIDNGPAVSLSHAINGKVFSLLNAIDLIEPNPSFLPKKKLSRLIETLHENDNPVVRIVTLRDEFICD